MIHQAWPWHSSHSQCWGVRLLHTSEHIQIAGFVDQTQIDTSVRDYGVELDPHGADFVSPNLL